MKCTECKGTGEIEVHSEMLMCPECFGKGEIKGKEPMSNTSETPLSVSGSLFDLKALLLTIEADMETNDIAKKKYGITMMHIDASLMKWRSTVVQAIKDAQFDQETNPLPFPEK